MRVLAEKAACVANPANLAVGEGAGAEGARQHPAWHGAPVASNATLFMNRGVIMITDYDYLLFVTNHNQINRRR